MPRPFGEHIKQFLFVTVWVMDSSRLTWIAEIEHLKNSSEEFLRRCVPFVNTQGLRASDRYMLGTDTVESLVQLCQQVAKDLRRGVSCAGKLASIQESFLTCLLHNQAAATPQRRLQFAELQRIVPPIRPL